MEFASDVVQCSTNLGKLDPVPAPDGCQNVRFDEVDEGEILPLRVIQVDHRRGSALLAGHWIKPP
jgi:hypothetical protein